MPLKLQRSERIACGIAGVLLLLVGLFRILAVDSRSGDGMTWATAWVIVAGAVLMYAWSTE